MPKKSFWACLTWPTWQIFFSTVSKNLRSFLHEKHRKNDSKGFEKIKEKLFTKKTGMN